MSRAAVPLVPALLTVGVFSAAIASGFLLAQTLGDGTALLVLALIAVVLLAAVFLPVIPARPEPDATLDLPDGRRRALVLRLPIRPQRILAVSMLVGVVICCLAAADPAASPIPFMPPIAYFALAGLTGLVFAPVFLHWNMQPLFALTAAGLVLRAAGVQSLVPWSAIGNLTLGTISGTRTVNLQIAIIPGAGATRSGSLLWPRIGQVVNLPTRWLSLRPSDLQSLVRYYWAHPDKRSSLGRDRDAIRQAIGERSGDQLTEDEPWRFVEG